MEQDSRFTNNLYRKRLKSQVTEEYAKVVYTFTVQIIHARRLFMRYRILKWAMLILSAITASAYWIEVVATTRWLVAFGGLLSVALVVLSAYFKDYDFSAIHTRHLKTANALWLIRERYLSLLTDFDTMDLNQAVEQRDLLLKETSAIYDDAPLTDGKSYAVAQKALKEDEAQFFTQSELNQMLPEALRQPIPDVRK